jgi:small-conductance mechanosensitive channel
MEAIKPHPDRPIRSWMQEIGSDVRWLTIALGVLGAIVAIVQPFWSPIVGLVRVLAKVNLSVFCLLVAIAAVSVLVDLSKRKIDANKKLTKNDRRNLLTLLPIATSAIKLILYFGFCVAVLAAVGVDVRPFLEVGAIGLVILGLAGQSIIADMLSTLFIFTDRLFYVGDRLAFLCGEEWIEGEVISISLRYTIVRCENSHILAIANRQLDKFKKV